MIKNVGTNIPGYFEEEDEIEFNPILSNNDYCLLFFGRIIGVSQIISLKSILKKIKLLPQKTPVVIVNIATRFDMPP